MNELDVVSVSCVFAELAFMWGSQVWEPMGFVYGSHSHRPWGCSEAGARVVRAHLGQIVSNAHPFLELEFPARAFRPGQLVLLKQERWGPAVRRSRGPHLYRKRPRDRFLGGSAQVWADPEDSFS